MGSSKKEGVSCKKRSKKRRGKLLKRVLNDQPERSRVLRDGHIPGVVSEVDNQTEVNTEATGQSIPSSRNKFLNF
jgi:hypothetical protein